VIFSFVFGFALLAMANAGEMPEISLEEMNTAFEQFKRDFGRSYAPELEPQRKLIFVENYGFIRGFNWEAADLGISYRLGVNNFADLTNEEFRRLYLSHPKPASVPRQVEQTRPWSDLPDSVDWVAKGVVTPVRDQGPLGASWTFAAVAAIESAYALYNGTLVELSEQNLIDCCTRADSECRTATDGFVYVIRNNGIETEKAYPFHGGSQQYCYFDPTKVGATITGLGSVESGNETDLQDATAKVGPVAVTINASLRSFQFYTSGIYDDASCTSDNLDHDVVVVGYGLNATGAGVLNDERPFWKVKNSWGKSWGEEGYIRLARNANNLCGIASLGAYPLEHNN